MATKKINSEEYQMRSVSLFSPFSLIFLFAKQTIISGFIVKKRKKVFERIFWEKKKLMKRRKKQSKLAV